MSILYLNCSASGLSGDMMVAALHNLGVPAEKFQALAGLLQHNLNGTENITVAFEEISCKGVPATYLNISIKEHKHHRSIETLKSALNATAKALNLPTPAIQLAHDIFDQIVQAESHIHKIQPSDVHLHEIASADTLFDAIGVALGISELGLFEGENLLYISDVAVGGGSIQIAHGLVPVPAPATAEILQTAGLIITGGPVDRELTTPTGAAILVALKPIQSNTLPRMKIHAVGRGAGKLAKDGVASPVTLLLGEVPKLQEGFEDITMLETNLDDLPGEYLGYVLERVIVEGALDAYLAPVIMKKSRPGQVLHVLCTPADAPKMREIILSETGTLGVRQINLNRFCIARSFSTIKISINQHDYEVQVKVHEGLGGTAPNFKPEFEDLRKISQAEGIPVNQLAKLVIKKYLEERET